MATRKAANPKQPHCCKECRMSILYHHCITDPVLAKCTATKILMARQGGKCEMSHPINVASTPHFCELFEQSAQVKSVELIKERRAV